MILGRLTLAQSYLYLFWKLEEEYVSSTKIYGTENSVADGMAFEVLQRVDIIIFYFSHGYMILIVSLPSSLPTPRVDKQFHWVIHTLSPKSYIHIICFYNRIIF